MNKHKKETNGTTYIEGCLYKINDGSKSLVICGSGGNMIPNVNIDYE